MSTNSDKFKKHVENIVDALKDNLNNEKITKVLAERMSDTIVKRTKTGYGVVGSDKWKLLKLSPAYKTRRKSMELPSWTSPTMSNLTATGQMLTSVKEEYSKGKAKVYIPDTTRKGSDLTNKKVAEFVTENGRPFFGLTTGEIRIIMQLYKDLIKSVIKKIQGNL